MAVVVARTVGVVDVVNTPTTVELEAVVKVGTTVGAVVATMAPPAGAGQGAVGVTTKVALYSLRYVQPAMVVMPPPVSAVSNHPS